MTAILVVEDDRHQLETYATHLELTNNYDLHRARTLEEAQLKLKERDYDVVVTDLKLPTIEIGFKVIGTIAKKPGFGRTKVIIYTQVGSGDGEVGFDSIRFALQMGVSDYIVKHWDRSLEILDLTIRKILGTKEVSSINYGQAFIASPYDKHHKDIYDKLNALAVRKSRPYHFIRADDRYRVDFLKEIIVEDIQRSEYVIAFISGLNSNVMYELGLAHGLGKKVILVKDEDDETDICADLKGLQYISYSIRGGEEEIAQKVLIALEDFNPLLPESWG